MVIQNKPSRYTNGEGYNDPTASAAINSITAEEEKVCRLIKTLKSIINLSGFSLECRIVVKSRKSGKTYR